MAAVTSELIGEQLTRMFDEMRALKADVTDLKGKVATKKQLGLVWRSLELKIELGLDQQHDAVGELKRSVAALEARVKTLEERPR
jgi:ubiquinone biosynthesis protein UbiJ